MPDSVGSAPPSTSSAALPLYYNFISFSLLYSITHASVDAVLAFSVAELGPVLGSYGGFSLYICYTLSALLFAKPALKFMKSKYVVLLGLCGLLSYVISFFIAISAPSAASAVFIAGACVGGLGAGLLWTGQGSYYSTNAQIYSAEANKELSKISTTFASIFAGLYLSLETAFKILATLVFLSMKHQKSSSWKQVVFGLYSALAFVAVFLFYIVVKPLYNVSNSGYLGCNENDTEDDNRRPNPSNTDQQKNVDDSQSAILLVEGSNGEKTSGVEEVFLVMKAIFSDRLLQLIIPYQLTFGFTAGFVEFYINGHIVRNYLGDGYIGLLSAITTLTAVAVTAPFAFISNRYEHGKCTIMIFGGICFFIAGLPLLVAEDNSLGNWGFLIFYSIIWGMARGIWEGINKSIITDYFQDSKYRDVAFAVVYFTSGLSGAIGFIVYQYMSRRQLAILNTSIPIIATICFYRSYSMYLRGKENLMRNAN